MPITTDASPDELDSPFLLKNKETCEQWEKLFSSYAHTLNAKYSAWAYKLKATVRTRYKWDILVSRSQFTGGRRVPTIILESLDIDVEPIIFDKTSIKIRKKRKFDVKPKNGRLA